MRESILPRMKNATQDMVLGGLIKHARDHKMVIVIGEPGEGKTVTVLDFCAQNASLSYYYRCSPNTTMNSLLVFMANAIGIRVVGGNDELQNRIQQRLKHNPNYCFVFDEAEYLAYGNGAKIDVLRQIYDESNVPIILCGTYILKDLISGAKKEEKGKNHNRPQIFRRLRKEELDLIEENEIYDYLKKIEKSYKVSIESSVKVELVTQCQDRQSGGLGNFIEILELLLSQVRPEWEEISYQIIEESGRILHNHNEKAQAYTSIRKDRVDLENEEIEKINIETGEVLNSETPKAPYVDIEKLELAVIDWSIYEDSLRHKMIQ